ncbi:VOC family protein [Micromonospora sp. WMMD1082]|uniref:VOC family protein n=1 Tax=Micromonospora sp. WMMD1082 TaxID=3016104 RepID=UPI002415DEBE|nr:VOC family protein [Micromonospora sp. WMMD1082]MDG4798750.1 VOC family protein [Micromonospora sp. WMMD1082]
MANEVTIPLLPCASIDDIRTFYEVLGFRTTYQQRKPNPHVALQREDLNLHFFEMAGFDPAQSYGSCLVLTPDISKLHREFAAGMRAAYGKVLVSGTPRMTRPRARKNNDGLGGFSVIDPGGNWIRITESGAPAAGPATTPAGRLAKVLANAVVLADSKGDVAQAARILDSALARPRPDDDPVEQVEALVYRAELAVTLQDTTTAAELLARADRVVLGPDETERAAPAFENAADLAAALR